MTLKLYFDLLSQPSRGLFMFFKAAKIPFQPVQIALRKAEHLTDEYKKVNKFQKVPCIDHNGFKLTESVAIIRYAAREFTIDDHWYPKDSIKQSRVDEYLEWQHNNTRLFCAMFFDLKWRQPLLTGKPPNPSYLKEFEKGMVKCLDEMESLWLLKDPYLTGNTISVADILGTCEIEQTKLGDYNPCEGRPKLKAWMDRVKNDTNPYYDEAHKFVYKAVEFNKTNAPWLNIK